MSYCEDDYLMISGIQHFAFCRRQWALIHIENQWQDNVRTIQGDIMHERAHDTSIREKRGSVITIRGLRVSSSRLGVSGACDVVEFHESSDGTRLKGETGHWQPFPVEYKAGVSKDINADRLQLCAQAICLEEMLGCPIPEGALYYGESRRRENVSFSEALRQSVIDLLQEMHDYYARGYTPKVRSGTHCNACSLKAVCIPALNRNPSVSLYMSERMQGDEA